VTSRTELLAQAFREALDSVVSPDVRESMLHHALAASGETSLPSDPERFHAFVAGPLRRTLVAGLGEALGESVVAELERMARLSFPPAGELELERRDPPSVPLASLIPFRTTPSPVPFRTTPSPVLRESAPPALSDVASFARRETAPSPVTPAGKPRGKRENTPAPALRETKRAPPREPMSRPDTVIELDASEFGSIPAAPAAPRLPIDTEQGDPFTDLRPPSSKGYPRGVARVLGVVGAGSDSNPPRLPRILVASRDPAMVRRLAAWLDPRIAVLRVRSALDLIHDLDDAAGVRSVVVVDCQEPSVRPIALAALSDDLPPTVQVVLWGATPELHARVLGISENAEGWYLLDEQSGVEAVAERCAELFR